MVDQRGSVYLHIIVRTIFQIGGRIDSHRRRAGPTDPRITDRNLLENAVIVGAENRDITGPCINGLRERQFQIGTQGHIRCAVNRRQCAECRCGEIQCYRVA